MSTFPDTSLPENIQQVRKTAAISLVVNIFLSIFKFVCGMLGKSQVMMADAVHTLSDTVTDVAVFTGSEYWSKPPDKEHPYGHRRIETLITIFISLSLASVGFILAYNGLVCLLEGDVQRTGWIAFIAAIPFSYFSINGLLDGIYKYHMTMDASPFILSVFIVLMTAILTIATQVYKAAVKNPIEAIRYE